MELNSVSSLFYWTKETVFVLFVEKETGGIMAVLVETVSILE
ncbi:hypothetical protein Enr17x_49180 [Gimesia fumaroli]|uniref:Uncharacterized protein n=1 Tax=Gimesia fumaroli TaxID=2527976 RepID=A0A518IID9_9PLAN|nr:hypothetical protein Enr17x_49180 [Gimesia fumaroli]